MHAVVIEHVKVKDLPELWRKQLAVSPEAQVTIRIEEEASESAEVSSLFGMWQDRDDLVDVDQHVRLLRRSRITPEL
jgi:hypothetical protein